MVATWLPRAPSAADETTLEAATVGIETTPSEPLTGRKGVESIGANH